MALTFAKLFSSLLDSTLWLSRDNELLRVFITLLLLSDSSGEVQISVVGLANRSGVTKDECKEALAALEAEDPDSYSTTDGGRRIVAIGGGWEVINYIEYRQKLSDDHRREKGAERQRRFKERKRRDGNASNDKEKEKEKESKTKNTKPSIPTPPVAIAPSPPKGGANGRKKSSRMTAKQIETVIGQHLALQALPGFAQAVLDWDTTLPAKKRWKSTGALTRRLRTLEKHSDDAIELVRMCTDELWADPLAAVETLAKQRGKASSFKNQDDPQYYR